MVVYHVDKFGMLQPGQKIADINQLTKWNKRIRNINGFFGGALQMFSVQLLKESECGNNSLALTEAILEYVRALKFRNLPSRLSVLYASRTIEEAERWRCELRPANPSSCIVSLCTGRKVYSSNFAMRDEVYAEVSEISSGSYASGSYPMCKLLESALPAAERYWTSISPAHRMLCSRNMGSEELLLVPPVRVLSRV